MRRSNLTITAAEDENGRTRGSREFIESAGKDERIDGGLMMMVGKQVYNVLTAVVRDDIAFYSKARSA